MILDITIQFLYYQNNVDCLKILYYSIETLAKKTKFAKKKTQVYFPYINLYSKSVDGLNRS